MSLLASVLLIANCAGPCAQQKVEAPLAELVAAVRSADYRGDRASLERRPGWIEARLAMVGSIGNLIYLAGDDAEKRKVHRSHIVNLDAVQHLRPHDDRRLAITLRDGAVIVASRAASEDLRRLTR